MEISKIDFVVKKILALNFKLYFKLHNRQHAINVKKIGLSLLLKGTGFK